MKKKSKPKQKLRYNKRTGKVFPKRKISLGNSANNWDGYKEMGRVVLVWVLLISSIAVFIGLVSVGVFAVSGDSSLGTYCAIILILFIVVVFLAILFGILILMVPQQVKQGRKTFDTYIENGILKVRTHKYEEITNEFRIQDIVKVKKVSRMDILKQNKAQMALGGLSNVGYVLCHYSASETFLYEVFFDTHYTILFMIKPSKAPPQLADAVVNHVVLDIPDISRFMEEVNIHNPGLEVEYYSTSSS